MTRFALLCLIAACARPSPPAAKPAALANRPTPPTGERDEHALLIKVADAIRVGDAASLDVLADLGAADRAWLDCEQATPDELALHRAQVEERSADARDEVRKAIAFAKTHKLTLEEEDSPFDPRPPEYSFDEPVRVRDAMASACVVTTVPVLYEHRLWVYDDGESPSSGESIFVDTLKIDDRWYVARIRSRQYRPDDRFDWPLPFGRPFRVDTISRTTAYVRGGTVIQITGSGFISGGDRKLRVLFGEQQATIDSLEDWRMFVRAPARTTSDDVAVTVVAEPGGSTVIAKSFRYLHDVNGLPPACAAVKEFRRARVPSCPISAGDRKELRDMIDNEIRLWDGAPDDPDCDRTLEIANTLCTPPPEEPDEADEGDAGDETP